MTNDYIYKTWKSALASHLEERYKPRQVASMLGTFDKMAAHKKYGNEAAFAYCMENYGSCDTPTAVEQIKRQLELANTNSIETNGVVRIRKAIDTFNANLDKCSGFEIAGLPETNLAPHQLEAIKESREQAKRLKQKLPAIFSAPAPIRKHECLASYKGKQIAIEVTW